MRPIVLLLALLLPSSLLLAPAAATSCPADGSAVSLGAGHYLAPRTGSTNTGVFVGGIGVKEQIFLWPMGATAEVWEESNGVPGLQKHDSHCGPRDIALAGASVGLGRPFIPL